MGNFILFSIFLAILINIGSAYGEGNEINYEDLSLNPGQKLNFNKFKSEVKKRLIITQDYMWKDMYLLKWLKATEFNVKEAVEKMRKMLAWRKLYKQDTILEEDFTDFERDFPFSMDANDKIGRPVGTANVQEWDIRRVVLAGKREKAIRFVFRMAEVGVMKVMEQHEKNANVSSGIILLNLKGFNTITHGCPECIPICRNLVVSLESYFPFMVYKFIGINTPIEFYSVFNLFAPLLKKHVRSVITIYGTDKRKWKKAILALVDSDQIDLEFGGTRKGRHEQ